MNIIRVAEKESVKPLQVVLACLVLAGLAGSFLLTTGPHGTMEGARDWHEESLLRAVVHVLNLAYTQTTSRAVEIKWLVFVVAAGLASVAMGVAMLTKSKIESVAESDTVVGETSSGESISIAKRQIPPLAAAQVMLVLFALWSFASALWSHAPGVAIGGSILLAICVLWALVIGRGLPSRPAIMVTYGLFAVCTIAALLAIVYFDVRNPNQRVGYPIGNPLFLAACLLPGFLGGVHLVWTGCRHDICKGIVKRFVIVALAIGSVAAIYYAIKLTGSRSAIVAGVFGLVALFFFESAKREKLIAVVVVVVITVFGIRYIQTTMFTPSDTGRDASLRTRIYSWSYAQDLIQESIIIGHGQGGYTMLADQLVRNDVLADAIPLDARIAHAHNEWLEVWADLGIIGFALIASSLVLTLMAGVRTVGRIESSLTRGTLITLMAVLVALVVEECADNALRVAGLPIVFYTVIGLIWAFAREVEPQQDPSARRTKLMRPFAGVALLMFGFASIGAGIVDFQAARDFFEVETALFQKEYDRAESLASYAARNRLSPQRRLEAVERQCATHLQIARDYQSAYTARLSQLAQNPVDQNLKQLLERDRRNSLTHLEKASDALTELVEKSPEFFSAGWRGYQIYTTMLYLAETANDTEAASRYRLAAAQSLNSDLVRRPFEPMIALSYVDIAADQLTVDEAITILARPLRYNSIPVEYGQYLAAISPDPAWAEQISAIGESVAGVSDLNDTDQPWAAEKLRILADIYVINGKPALSVQLASRAVEQYESIDNVGLVGPGACLAELADYQFFVDPANAETSLKQVDEAISMLPNSTPGRQLKRALAGRAVVYCLAAGQEGRAVARMKDLAPDRPEAAIKSDLTSAYTVMTRNALQHSGGTPSPKLETWMTRALVLSPESHIAWWVNAQLQFAFGRVDNVVESLQKAVLFGGDVPAVLNFAQAVRDKHPDHGPLNALIEALQQSSTVTPSQPRESVNPPQTTPAP